MDRQSVKAKIQKLMRLSASDNEHEATSAARMMRKLMIRYNFEEHELEEEVSEEPIKRNEVQLSSGKRLASWKKSLMWGIARYLDIYALWMHGTCRFGIYGTRTDAEIAGYIFKVAAREIDREAKQWLSEQVFYSRGDGKRYGNDFRRSAVSAFLEKIMNEKQQDNEALPESTAVAIRSKLDRCKAANTGKVSMHKTPHYRSNEAGRRAGRRININKALSSSSGAKKFLS